MIKVKKNNTSSKSIKLPAAVCMFMCWLTRVSKRYMQFNENCSSKKKFVEKLYNYTNI